jgi:hypothetical protein
LLPGTDRRNKASSGIPSKVTVARLVRSAVTLKARGAANRFHV